MNPLPFYRLVLPLAAAAGIASVALGGCDDSATTAIVENGSPNMTILKAWWGETLFPGPIAPGASSEIERTTPGNTFAYALLAPGWSADSGAAPSRLIAIKSSQKLAVAAHDRLRIAISDDQFVGNCAAGKPLAAEDARLIVEAIFPGEFGGAVYDPATCTSTTVSVDGNASDDANGSGRDAAADAGTD
jgi:hypothetical protein